MKNFLTIWIILLAFSGMKGQSDSVAIKSFDSSRFVFAGKVVGYQSEFRAEKEYFFIEFEMMSIYKGERKYRTTVVADSLNQFLVDHYYLLYTLRNKEKDADGKRLGYYHYSPVRYVELFENKSNPEPEELRKYIKTKFLRRVKKPLSEARANCHCGV
ncbi:MAG: hypothetical protein A2W91_01250 [Bacteroidetes bacterium GWF2_38_335]|nr:MAG: hypothetical protein A2W91_01250 [Bacteroidetes bacterium GWF2_38_335]OFY80972.1 MAG: hypothetical protein A2281_13015 [Bacteroidetes bacterium RIFOXYA12_FULL_38_20]HBS85089.1 hypothetical protein [Bacteroidales bacterium]